MRLLPHNMVINTLLQRVEAHKAEIERLRANLKGSVPAAKLKEAEDYIATLRAELAVIN